MTSPLLNRHPSWFSDPDTFNPDRFLEDPQLMKRHLTFGKGGRVCLGINLAYQELHSFPAALFLRYGRYDESLKDQKGPTLELYETTKMDVELYSDFVTAGTHPDSKGVRVRVRRS
ncbi:cytochrome p450 domain-containing protein [Sarocladium implicatum]|nr:cytochrome p450 domain-containing protein [Sarocladium implicatum]